MFIVGRDAPTLAKILACACENFAYFILYRLTYSLH